ncbi:MAG: crotonase/enoyl-CoA hydratase family protein [Archaeoglobales archaeon]|nr:crotonase/enoyl-CoA hydratase family protein [Archaeoglobales archaeon]
MPNVVVDREDKILIVKLNRAEKRNAINLEMAEELEKVWKDFEKDQELYVGIITGEGGNFCAGADLGDLKHLMSRATKKEGPLGFTRILLSKPVIAAISGYCVAGGLEIALWADLRIADETAKFGFLERRFGVPLINGGTQRLPRIVGVGNALYLILTGKLISAREALELGLVNEVVEEGRALERAIELARLIASFPQITLRNDRKSLYAGLGKPLEEGLGIEAEIGLESLRSEELYREAEKFVRNGKGRHGKL